jgi:hypothetical protein
MLDFFALCDEPEGDETPPPEPSAPSSSTPPAPRARRSIDTEGSAL